MNSHDLDNITDPSDFKATKLPQLSELDHLNRCFICKDYLAAPVSISTCHHIYCSQCIREHLLRNSSCPICKCEVFETNLAPVPLLEELVRCFRRLRGELLVLLKKEEQEEKVIENAEGEGEVKEEEEGINGEMNGDIGKNEAIEQDARETTETSAIDTSNGDIEILSENSTMGVCPLCNERMPIDIIQGPHFDACVSGKIPKRSPSLILQQPPKKKQTKGKTSITSFFKQSSSPEITTPPPPPVQTPPQQPKQGETLDDELEILEVREGSKETPVIKAPPRIAKLDFHSLTTPKLKTKLKELKLSTTGDRQELMRRYNQYFVFVNANIDSNHPVDESTLRERLSKWERSFKSKSKDSLGTDAGWKSWWHKLESPSSSK
ncbi:Postreplication repair E3 ubiquitin-protein ligase RAD18 [Candida viswanathii]|uniref:Postreplication repair E3 ubiquitin-protein ligase RAD18 n=1 Tax=Candida viswanathii TaxID=5486 RepID=A0A367XX73_9ASCO|nr:Postreplication repair E3 ubiquitin-protein ligase RAD18 [Candida viswanathii]